MKKSFILTFLFFFAITGYSQTIINGFETAAADSFFWYPPNHPGLTTDWNGSLGKIIATDVNSSNDPPPFNGNGAMKIEWTVHSTESWGGYNQVMHLNKNLQEGYIDFSSGTELRLRYYNAVPSSVPGTVYVRMRLYDAGGSVSSWTDQNDLEAWFYEGPHITDSVPGWKTLVMPLVSRGAVPPNSEGFSAPGWNGTKNNGVLDLDKLVGYDFEFNTNNIPNNGIATGTIYYDYLTLDGKVATPFVFFNGKSIPNALGSGWAWGQSTLELVQGAGPVPELNALKWVQGNEWSNGWTGIGFSISPVYDMSASWATDSLKFKMKAESGVGPLRVQLEGAGGKVGKVFQPTDDNQWHQYIIALRDLVPQDATTGFDSSKVNVFGIMAEASGIAGKVIYMSEIWTGTPKIDVLRPKEVTGLAVIQGNQQNLITWIDVQGESGEAYDIYYSESPITDIANAEILKLGVPENTQLLEQILLTPIANQDNQLTYYYAIVCKDDAGNYSLPSYLNTPTSNLGKGVATIAKTAPPNFIADGDLSEWVAVPQIRIIQSEGSGFPAGSGLIDGDQDCNVLAYLAVDQDNLYFAADVTDDIYSWKKRNDPWMNDAINFYLGLFDSHNTYFASYKRGATPHYQFRFDEEKVVCDNSDSLLFPGTNYYFGQKTLTPGYFIEAKIPFVDIAKKRNYNYSGADSVFHPVEGMKIPIDFSINDADATGDRELVLCYSPYNNDQSWNDPRRWLWTWIGDKMTVGVEDAVNNIATSYNLAQNYPNPFNPATKISYSLEKPELVSLRVFDMLGREVSTLVNQYQTAGEHTVNFNANNLASGLYLYKLEAGSYQSIKKMLLLK